MPMYEWHCTKCDCRTQVLRSFADYQKPPTAKDVATKCTKGRHKWEREIGGNQAVHRAWNWGSKGNW